MASASGSARKLSAQKAANVVGGAILRPPALGDLLDAAADAGGVLGAVPLDLPVDGLLNDFEN